MDQNLAAVAAAIRGSRARAKDNGFDPAQNVRTSASIRAARERLEKEYPKLRPAVEAIVEFEQALDTLRLIEVHPMTGSSFLKSEEDHTDALRAKAAEATGAGLNTTLWELYADLCDEEGRLIAQEFAAGLAHN